MPRLVSLLFLLLTAAAAPAWAAPAYTITALIDTESHGRLTCGAAADGAQPLFGVSDEFALTFDAWGPDAPASIQVKPIVLLKEVDRCSPPLFQALVGRERLSTVEVRLLDRQGVHFFTIRLEDAQVTRITRTVRQHGLQEEVGFVFRVIHLIDERSGISASHDFGG